MGHWVLLMMGIKPLVALLPRQCNARRLVRPFREEPLFAHVATVRRIHSMTLGTMVETPGVLHEGTVAVVASLASLPTTLFARQAAMGSLTPHGLRTIPRSLPSHLGTSQTVALLRCPTGWSTLTREIAHFQISRITARHAGPLQGLLPHRRRSMAPVAMSSLRALVVTAPMVSRMDGSTLITRAKSRSGIPSCGTAIRPRLWRWTTTISNM